MIPLVSARRDQLAAPLPSSIASRPPVMPPVISGSPPLAFQRSSRATRWSCIFSWTSAISPNPDHSHYRSHEDMLQNQQYDGSRAHHTGFHIEVARKYGEDDRRVYDAFHSLFESIPLAHVVESMGSKRKMMVVHGGLFMERGVTIAQLQRIRRRLACRWSARPWRTVCSHR